MTLVAVTAPSPLRGGCVSRLELFSVFEIHFFESSGKLTRMGQVSPPMCSSGGFLCLCLARASPSSMMFLTSSFPTHTWLRAELCCPRQTLSPLHPCLLWLLSLTGFHQTLDGMGFRKARAAGVSLPEHREDRGVGREDLDRLAEFPAHLPPPDLSFGTPLHNFRVCCASAYQSGTGVRPGIFVSFAALSPVRKACPAHSRCSKNTCGMPSSLPSRSLPTLLPLPRTLSLTLLTPAHSSRLSGYGFFRKAVPEPSNPGSVVSLCLQYPVLPPARHLSYCFIFAPSLVFQIY